MLWPIKTESEKNLFFHCFTHSNYILIIFCVRVWTALGIGSILIKFSHANAGQAWNEVFHVFRNAFRLECINIALLGSRWWYFREQSVTESMKNQKTSSPSTTSLTEIPDKAHQLIIKSLCSFYQLENVRRNVWLKHVQILLRHADGNIPLSAKWWNCWLLDFSAEAR